MIYFKIVSLVTTLKAFVLLLSKMNIIYFSNTKIFIKNTKNRELQKNEKRNFGFGLVAVLGVLKGIYVLCISMRKSSYMGHPAAQKEK